MRKNVDNVACRRIMPATFPLNVMSIRNPDGSPDIDINSLPIGPDSGGFATEHHRELVSRVLETPERFVRRERAFSQLDPDSLPGQRLDALRELYAVPLKRTEITSRQLEDEGALKIADALRRQDR